MAPKKKIALCIEYPLELQGGVSVLVKTLLAGLREKYDLILVSADKTGDMWPGLAGHVHWNWDLISPKYSRELAETLARLGTNLAHFHQGGNYNWGNRFIGHCPIPYLNRLGIPACSTVHSVVDPLDGYCGAQRSLLYKLALLPLAWAGKMNALHHLRREIAVSMHDRNKLRRWYWPLRGKFIQIYHSRIQDHPPENSALREPVVLNVGHVAWRKGQLILAEAFAQIASKYPEWKLNIVGGLWEKPVVEKIRAIAISKGLENRILLSGERTDTMELMKRAGIYVQPSYQEALGLALQEAMFVGCPSIGSRVGGIPELIDHEKTGLLVEAGDVNQMAQALETLMSNPALREKLGRQGAASIIEKGMTASQMVARHIELYESILQSH